VTSGSAQLVGTAWRQDRVKTIVAAALVIGGAAAAPLSAVALGWMTNQSVAGHGTLAALSGVALAVLALAGLTFNHFAHVCYYELSELSVLDLETQVMVVANGSPELAYQENPQFADRLTTVRKEIQRLRAAFEALLALVGLVLALGLTVVLLATVNLWLLALLPAAIIPLTASRRAEQIISRSEAGSAEDHRMATGIFRLTCAAGSGKELRVFRLRDTMLARHRERWDRATTRLWRAHLRAALIRMAGQFVFAVCYLAGVLLVVRAAVADHRSVGDLIMSVALAALVNQQVGTGVALLHDLQRMASTLRDLSALRASVAIGAAPRGAAPPARLTRGIELVDVAFAYPERDGCALRDINLALPAGSTVAIVGENGAGKTSLTKLLCGFYRPTAGAILVDGRDLAQLDAQRWQRSVAVGFQDFVRFELLAREAVGVGDLPRLESEEAILGAIERAQASDLVDKLDNGLDTELGASYPHGVELSGGQWQKLALGRAFMRETPLLVILDEPTASLDPPTEHALFERYAEHARVAGKRTGAITILVSHRFSTVRTADLIVVLDGSRILQTGNHASLMSVSGLYADLYGMQAKAYEPS
jgi:ATP-binding cassette subfamily B protein